METFAIRLKHLREEKNVSQEELATILGIDKKYYAQYESGSMDLLVANLAILADYFHVSVDDLAKRSKHSGQIHDRHAAPPACTCTDQYFGDLWNLASEKQKAFIIRTLSETGWENTDQEKTIEELA